MKPLAIIQFIADDAPAYFTETMRAQNVPYRIFCMHMGEAVPQKISAFGGLCLLGGTISANDDLDFMPAVYRLIADALAHDIPVIGHCLGGQMLARALGAVVKSSPQPEIGWCEITPAANAEARRWFGAEAAFHLYHWHYESFSLPGGATHIASTALCANQAFCLGKHIGMQFHCEVNREKIDGWLTPEAEAGVKELQDRPGVQQFASMREDTDRWLPQSQRIAANIYAEWLRGVDKS